MNVVLVMGGRGLRPSWVPHALAELGVEPDEVELTLVTWHAPAASMPVAEHWVVGGEHPGRHPVKELPRAAAGPRGSSQVPLVRGVGLPESAVPASEEQGAETVPVVDEKSDGLLPAGSATRGRPPTAVTRQGRESSRASLRTLTPHRVRAALRWRARRVQRRVLGGAPGGPTRVGRLIQRLLQSPRVKHLQADRAATRFAVAAAGDREIRAAVARADVVVGVDGGSHRAVWLLARRVPGPDVVIGMPAGKRVLSERRRRAAGE